MRENPILLHNSLSVLSIFLILSRCSSEKGQRHKKSKTDKKREDHKKVVERERVQSEVSVHVA